MNTFVDLVRGLEHVPEERALYLHPDMPDDPEVIPWRDLYRRVRVAMDHFAAQGVGPGTRVLFPFETSAEVITAFLALVCLGALPLSVKPHLLNTDARRTLDYYAALTRRFGVSRVLATPSVAALELPAPPLSLAPSEGVGGAAPMVEVGPDDLAFVQFSSGTTGDPKGVPISHHRAVRNVQLNAAIDGRDKGGVGASWLPLYHDMGLIGGLLGAMLAGSEMHLTSPLRYLLDPVDWLHVLSRHRAAIMPTPNFGIDYALRRVKEAEPEDLEGLDLSALRCVYIGSEPINVEMLDEFVQQLAPFGLRRSALKPCYGMAEAVLIVSSDRPDDEPAWRVLPGGATAVRVGWPLPGFDVSIRRDDGTPAGPGELGEIIVAGGTLADAYFEDSRPLAVAGGYATGDVGLLVDGALYIAGRAGDRMKVNGQSYFATQFEQAIETLPFVRAGRTAVVQPQDHIVALVEVAGLAHVRRLDATRDAIVDKVMAETGLKLRAEDIHLVRYRQLPKTSSGKLRRGAVAEAVLEGRIRDTDVPGYLLDRVTMGWQRVVGRIALALRGRPART